jgi:hypothetical protein
MTNIKVLLHDGTEITTTVDSFDPNALAETINNREVLMVPIGNTIVNKTSIKVIEPVESAS